MRVPTLSDLNVNNKKVLVRIDLNSDILRGKLIPSKRLTASLETIGYLQKQNASIILIAHQGRPGSNDFTSLKQHAHYLKKYLDFQYVQDIVGKKAIRAIQALKPKQVLLLENIRKIPDELKYEKGKPNKLIDTLAPLVDRYVNDAFSASHREHASIIGFPQTLPSAIGLVFERELKAIQKLKIDNALLILGGVKPDDYLELIERTRGPILPTGFLGLLVLEVNGYPLGKEEVMLKPFKKLLPFIKRHKSRFVNMQDVAIELASGKRQDLSIQNLPSERYMYDVGKQTLENYKKHIKKAKTIFFKGLPGLCHTKAFTLGTKTLLEAVANSNAFSVVGGGHTLTFIEKLRIPEEQFGYVSLSGGALMYYLAYSTLPGLEALRS